MHSLALPDEPLVLFGCSHGTGDERKGFAALQAALEQITDRSVHLVLFWKAERYPVFAYPHTHLGHISSRELLAELYNAVDITVVPSVQEPFGLVAAESLLCGTPVVCFEGTGTAGMIRHRENGYIAQQGDTSDLAAGICYCLDHRMVNRETKKLTAAHSASQHIQLYREILDYA